MEPRRPAEPPRQIRCVTCGKDGLRRCWRRDPKAAGSSDCPIGHDFQPKDPAPTAKWAGPRRGSGGDRTVRDSSARGASQRRGRVTSSDATFRKISKPKPNRYRLNVNLENQIPKPILYGLQKSRHLYQIF